MDLWWWRWCWSAGVSAIDAVGGVLLTYKERENRKQLLWQRAEVVQRADELYEIHRKMAVVRAEQEGGRVVVRSGINHRTSWVNYVPRDEDP